MIAFLLSPIGKLIGAAGIILLLAGGFMTWLHFHDKALLAGYVLRSEKVAAEAERDEIKRQLREGQIVIDEYQNRLRAIKEEEAAQDAADEQRDKAYEERLKAAGGSRGLTADDLDYLLRK